MPVSLHDEVVASGKYSLEHCRTEFVELCRRCHIMAHKFVTTPEMAQHFPTKALARPLFSMVRVSTAVYNKLKSGYGLDEQQRKKEAKRLANPL